MQLSLFYFGFLLGRFPNLPSRLMNHARLLAKMDEQEPTGEKMPAPAVELVPADAAKLPKIIRFDELARCGDEIWIENDGQLYRLRKTKQGKLILTK